MYQRTPESEWALRLGLLALFCLCLLMALPAGAETAVSGNIKDLGANNCPAYQCEVRLELVNCGDNQPKVGSSLIGGDPPPMKVDSSGNYSGTVYGNDQIACAGVTDTTRYLIGIWRSGRLLTIGGRVVPKQRYHLTGSTFNPATATAETEAPPSVTPDYALRNGSNSFQGTQDFEQATVSGIHNISSFALEAPTAADAGKLQLKWPRDVEIVRVSCATDAGTVPVNFDIRSESLPNSMGTSVLSSPLVCIASTAVLTTFLNNFVPANTPVSFDPGTPSGAGLVRVYVETKSR